MKILGVDSSTNVASAAVLDGDKLLCETVLNDKLTHSTKLLPLIQQLLDMAGLSVSDIDRFACVTGPGSFTGLRIGVAAVKGLAAVNNAQTVSVNALEALAMNLPYCRMLICPMIDARNKQAFTALYDTESGYPETKINTQAILVEDMLKTLKRLGKPVVFLGDGAAVNRDMICEYMGQNACFAPSHLFYNRASSVCMFAGEGAKITSYQELLPNYYRKSQAEQERLKKSQ